jgi:hypothetical protein
MNASWSKVDNRWYLAVNCQSCSEPILFAVDYSNRELPPEPAGKLFLTCASSQCLHRADYTSAKVLRFQRQMAASVK